MGSCLEISWKDAPTSSLSCLSFMFYPVDTRHDKSMRHFCTVRNSDVFSILQLMATLSLDQFPCHSSTSRMEHTWQQSRWYKSLVSHKAECIAVKSSFINKAWASKTVESENPHQPMVTLSIKNSSTNLHPTSFQQ